MTNVTNKILVKNYPVEERSQIIRLEVSNYELEGHVDLSDFVNLEYLDCSQNKITSLDISQCKNLKEVDISNNQCLGRINGAYWLSDYPQIRVEESYQISRRKERTFIRKDFSSPEQQKKERELGSLEEQLDSQEYNRQNQESETKRLLYLQEQKEAEQQDKETNLIFEVSNQQKNNRELKSALTKLQQETNLFQKKTRKHSKTASTKRTRIKHICWFLAEKVWNQGSANWIS